MKIPGAARPLTRILTLIIPFILVACSQQAALETVSRPEERALAESAIQDVIRNDSASLTTKMSPEIAGQVPSATSEMRKYLPAAQVQTVRLVDARFTTQISPGSAAIRHTRLIYELAANGRYSVAELAIVTVGNRQFLEGIHINSSDRPVSELGAFQFSGKSPVHYAMLLAAILAVGVTIAAVVKVWRSHSFERRWLWTIGCLVGVMSLTLDWASGTWSFQPISFKLFSASATKAGALAPWTLGVSLPLVALIVLFRRRTLDSGTA